MVMSLNKGNIQQTANKLFHGVSRRHRNGIKLLPGHDRGLVIDELDKLMRNYLVAAVTNRLKKNEARDPALPDNYRRSLLGCLAKHCPRESAEDIASREFGQVHNTIGRALVATTRTIITDSKDSIHHR